MRLSEFSEEEARAFSVLLRTVAGIDGRVSLSERAHYSTIAKRVGAGDFWTLLAQSDELEASVEAASKSRLIKQIGARRAAKTLSVSQPASNMPGIPRNSTRLVSAPAHAMSCPLISTRYLVPQASVPYRTM